MYFKADTLDDLLHEVLENLLQLEEKVTASRGTFTEIFGVILHLTNPLARLSRSETKGKAFSVLGEWLWYLSGTNNLDFIDYYLPGRYAKESDDKVAVRSAYGERLFNHRGINQIQSVIALLNKKWTTRRAVIQLFDASDLERDYASIPCTCTLQFLVRDNKLNMFVNMRSNDAYIGLAHDVFAFTMIQELVARSIEIELGEYKHSAASLHLYEEHAALASTYVAEAWQSTIAMPKMPLGDPWHAITKVRSIENAIRVSGVADVSNSSLDDYWKDLCWLLAAYRAYKAKNVNGLLELRSNLSCDTFKVFIDAKADALLKGDHAD